MPNAGDFVDITLPEPLTAGIIFRREGSRVASNVPHLVTHHSPTGFEFGYGGSGPADLALNAVEAILKATGHRGPRIRCFDGNCFALAFKLHHAFKWEFVAPADREAGAVIPWETAVAWVETLAAATDSDDDADGVLFVENLPEVP